MAVSAIYVAAETKRYNETTKPSSIIECTLNKSFADLLTKCDEFGEAPIVTKASSLILFLLFSCERK